MGSEKLDVFHTFEVMNKGADPFPAEFSLRRNLKDAATLSFTDEGIAIGQPLTATDMSTQQRKHGRRYVLPDLFIIFPVILDHPGPALDDMVGAVVKY